MRNFFTLTLLCVSFGIAGCDRPLPTDSQQAVPVDKGQDQSAMGDETDKPRFAGILEINAAKKGVNGPSEQIDFGAKPVGNPKVSGSAGCGPETSRSEVSWQFQRSEDGADVYDFQWTLRKSGQPAIGKTVEVAYTGTKTVVIDDEHYIVIKPRASEDVGENSSEQSASQPEDGSDSSGTAESPGSESDNN